jgi:TetR/AcrR family transcriptional repressor of nem operon
MTAAETVLTARGRSTRDRIVVAAATLIHERGVAGTSVDDVRAATATSKSQLYHYFADKSALVRAVIEHQVGQVLQAQQPELDSADSLAGLHRWSDRVVALNGQDTLGCPLGRLASELADSDPVAQAALTAGFVRWQDRLAAGLTTMQEHGALKAEADVRAVALGLLAAVQGGLLLAQASHSVVPLRMALDLALHSVEAWCAAPASEEPAVRPTEC